MRMHNINQIVDSGRGGGSSSQASDAGENAADILRVVGVDVEGEGDDEIPEFMLAQIQI